jgi:A/G-specific adenine glycosylase
MPDFGSRLMAWYDINKRDLPWRHTKDPYKIWLSEIILQQTRVEQGLNYYLQFVKRYPNVKKLAAADPDEIFKLWQGLGYYNRADNMLKAAKTIVEDYNAKLPANFDELRALKGIGNYTASAIASIAFGLPTPVVDGNVFRVLSRLFAIKTPINSSHGKKEFESIASRLMAHHNPGQFNQAMMEFGALYCTPKNPNCTNCIFKNDCQAWQKNSVVNFPVKQEKATIKIRYFYYLIIETEGKYDKTFVLKKRNGKDIWKNLYDFPLIELSRIIDPHKALQQFINQFNIDPVNFKLINISKKYQHQLTHQQINAIFIRIQLPNTSVFAAENSVLLINKNKITNFPVSRLIERYLQDQKMI